MKYVRVNGSTFALNNCDAHEFELIFEIPGSEDYNSIKSAFLSNSGDIEILDGDTVEKTYTGFTLLKSIFDRIGVYYVDVESIYNNEAALRILVETVPTVTQAQEFRKSIESMATRIPDEEAEKDIWAFPEWKYPVAYSTDERVQYRGFLYKCVQGHTSQADWAPDITPALWTRVGDPGEEWPEWIQPTGAHNAYAKGDKVSHNDKHWISDVDGNVWEPGVYGWTESN